MASRKAATLVSDPDYSDVLADVGWNGARLLDVSRRRRLCPRPSAGYANGAGLVSAPSANRRVAGSHSLVAICGLGLRLRLRRATAGRERRFGHHHAAIHRGPSLCGRLERALGEPLRADTYAQAADLAAQGVSKLCWNEANGLLADTPAQKHFSQHANILGVWLDVIPPAQQPAVLSKVLSTSDRGFSAGRPFPR